MQFETRLDTRELERNVCRYTEHSLVKSSRRIYSAGQKQFTEFCMLYDPSPVCQNTFCLFASHLAEGGLSYGTLTIKTYLSAVRNFQVTNDFEDVGHDAKVTAGTRDPDWGDHMGRLVSSCRSHPPCGLDH